ncbi:MAG: BatD family protein [Candidatus Riflebacteria bacterium]|nr:BatD family protein [Candidatus Riflebacteria bacterium]
MRKLTLLILTIALLNVTPLLCAQNFSINAEVDRDQVGFGESLSLVLTITRRLNSGVSQRINIPAVTNIPGFDIASTRSAQSTRYINGEGETESQILYELVPQQPGKITIPAFSFKDPEGNEHSTRPIEITVLPPEPAAKENTEPATSPAANRDSSGSWFRGILVLGLILGAIVALPFVIFAFYNSKDRPASSENSANFATQSGENMAAAAKKPEKIDIEDAVVSVAPENQSVQAARQQINFADAVASLKRQYPDADGEFYRRYFEIFREALLGRCSSLSANMTSDELFRGVCELATGDAVLQASRRLADDIDMVMYANRAPARAFAAIDADAREIVKAIID